jgi:hypothetical protein
MQNHRSFLEGVQWVVTRVTAHWFICRGAASKRTRCVRILHEMQGESQLCKGKKWCESSSGEVPSEVLTRARATQACKEAGQNYSCKRSRWFYIWREDKVCAGDSRAAAASKSVWIATSMRPLVTVEDEGLACYVRYITCSGAAVALASEEDTDSESL